MKTKIFLLTTCLIPFFSPVYSNPAPFLPNPEQNLVIRNRILTKVNDKTISVLDVAKKMEVIFSKQYPQYAGSPAAKFQFFSTHWKEIFLQMIDQELILADAEKLELKVTDSEVRETLHEKFGPNLMGTLDKLGLTYEEAKTMIYSELVVQKMTWFKVHSKALNAVNVQDVKSAYASYCEKNPPKELWEYQVLSVKAKSEKIAEQIAQRAFQLCNQTPSEIVKVSEKIKADFPMENPEAEFSISLSEEIQSETKSISTTHRDVLFKLAKNSISPPVKQTSRSDQSSVYRIFHLKNYTKTVLPSLRSMYEKIHNQLLQEAVEKESKVYMAKLRERYGFDANTLEDAIPSDFEPFALK